MLTMTPRRPMCSLSVLFVFTLFMVERLRMETSDPNLYLSFTLSGFIFRRSVSCVVCAALELLVGCLTSQQHARVSQGRICLTSQQHASVSQGRICLTSQQHACVSQGRICLTSQQHASVSQGRICLMSQQQACVSQGRIC